MTAPTDGTMAALDRQAYALHARVVTQETWDELVQRTHRLWQAEADLREARLLILSAQPAVWRNVHDMAGTGEAERLWQLLADRMQQFLAAHAEAGEP